MIHPLQIITEGYKIISILFKTRIKCSKFLGYELQIEGKFFYIIMWNPWHIIFLNIEHWNEVNKSSFGYRVKAERKQGKYDDK